MQTDLGIKFKGDHDHPPDINPPWNASFFCVSGSLYNMSKQNCAKATAASSVLGLFGHWRR